MIKVGDWVEVIEDGAFHRVGEKFIVERICEHCFSDIRGEAIMKHKVRPLKTEAEKRNAKLSDSITFKSTGTKGVFWKSTRSVFGEEWSVLMADGNILTTTPSQIRLDHEPEYKEIPFSEATHEQRMDAVNLRYSGSPVVQISHFSGSGYAFTYKGSFDIHTDTNNLTIRIPT